jgi:excisionase family DNA binding protein
MNEDDKVLLTVAEAAKRLGLSKTFTYTLVMSGDLESLKLGKARRVPVKALDEFVEAKRREQGF